MSLETSRLTESLQTTEKVQRTASLLSTHRVGFDTNGKGIAVATLKNKLPSFNFTFTEIHNEKYRSTPIYMGVSFRG